MYSTRVSRSNDEAFVRASANMRARFEARVMAAGSWTEGIASALSDLGAGLAEEMQAADMSVADLNQADRHQAGSTMRRSYDEARPARLAAMARAWRHHHPGVEVPELQLEFFTGAVDHVIVASLQRGDAENLAARLPGLTVLAPMADV
jgi:hypothetical protein